MQQGFDRVALKSITFFFLLASPLFAASGDPGPLKAEQEAKAKGYLFETSHDEIVAKARQEGSLRALIGWDPANYPHLIAAFKKKYPFIDVHLEEISSDGGQRFILEMKADRVRGWDVVHINTDHYAEFHPFLKRFDILAWPNERCWRFPEA